jgi:solute carrier family 25 citrate transporter 1
VLNEGFISLYKGLSAVMVGIVPKMAVRFSSYEHYKVRAATPTDGSTHLWSVQTLLGGPNGQLDQKKIFLAGLGAGVTEAVLVVTPAEVCKIRMQAQFHSMTDPTQVAARKYRNVVQTAVLIVKEEGPQALYQGLAPTVLRQGCNQAVNFTAYQEGKTRLQQWQQRQDLPHWQTLLLGGLSGGLGPLVNNPLDVCKTRLQRQSKVGVGAAASKYRGLLHALVLITKEEGPLALWKGLTPRLLRIMPGQAITFMTYEFVEKHLTSWSMSKFSTGIKPVKL